MSSQAALELLIQLSGAGEAGQGLDDLGEKGGGMGDAIKSGVAIAGGAILGLGGILVGATKAAADDEASVKALNTTMRNAGIVYEGATEDASAWIERRQAMGFQDDELRESLGTLILATGDLTQAQDLQATAMDLARMPGMDLEKATRALTKADNSSYTALGKLGIQIDKNTSKEEALRLIREASQGQAESYANSTVGSLTIMQNAVGEAFESVGAAILPLVSGPLAAISEWMLSPEFQAGITMVAQGIGTFLAGAFTTLSNIVTAAWPTVQAVFTFVKDNAGIILTALALTITAFVIPAFVAWATTMLTVALPALIATMAPIIAAAAPFLAVAAAIGLLWLAFENNFLGIRDLVVPVVEAIVAAVSRWWTEIQPKAIEAWNAISTTVVNAWNWLSSTVVAGVVALMDAWNSNWGGIQTIVTTAWNTISSIVSIAWSVVSGIISAGLSLLSGDWESAWNTVSTMLSNVWTTITTDLLPNALTMIGTLLTDFLPKLVGILWEWTTAFFNWIWTDIVPQLPGWLGSVIALVWTWITTNAPIWLENLGQWTTQIFDWIMTDVVPQLPGWLGSIAGVVWSWITGAAVSLGDKLVNEWLPAMWEWITGEGGVVATIGSKLGEIAAGIWSWITTTASAMFENVKVVGKNMADGIGAGFKAAWDGVLSSIIGPLTGVPANLNAAQGAKSPATLFMPVGANAAQGIGAGFTGAWNGVTSAMIASITAVGPAFFTAVKTLCDDDILAPIKKLCDEDVPAVMHRLTDADGVIAAPIVALCDADGPVAVAVRKLCDEDVKAPLAKLCDEDIPAITAGVSFDSIVAAIQNASHGFTNEVDFMVSEARRLAEEIASATDGSGYAGGQPRKRLRRGRWERLRFRW